MREPWVACRSSAIACVRSSAARKSRASSRISSWPVATCWLSETGISEMNPATCGDTEVTLPPA
jgi:hypothetical protein